MKVSLKLKYPIVRHISSKDLKSRLAPAAPVAHHGKITEYGQLPEDAVEEPL